MYIVYIVYQCKNATLYFSHHCIPSYHYIHLTYLHVPLQLRTKTIYMNIVICNNVLRMNSHAENVYEDDINVEVKTSPNVNNGGIVYVTPMCLD